MMGTRKETMGTNEDVHDENEEDDDNIVEDYVSGDIGLLFMV